MAVEAVASPKGKLVIRNVGLMLSGDLAQPLLSADTVVAVDGLIVAVGREKIWISRRPTR
jgi:enamidase